MALMIFQFLAMLAIPMLNPTVSAIDWNLTSYFICVALQFVALAIIYGLSRSAITRATKRKAQLERLLQETVSAAAKTTQDLVSANGFMRGIIEAQAGEIAILGEDGVIKHSNRSWDDHWSNHELTTDICCDKNCLEIRNLSFGSRNGINTLSSPTIQRVLSGESQFESLSYGCMLAGEERWFKIEITPFSCGSIHAVIIHREITAHYIAQRSLLDANHWNDRLASAVSKTHNAIIFTDIERRITWVNSGFERITGYSIDEVLGKSPGKLLQCASTNQQTAVEIRNAMNRCVPFRGKIKNVSKCGREYWLDLDIHPMFDKDGELEGFMAVESDVTELVEALISAETALIEVSTLRNALDHHSMLSVTDVDGTITDVNSGFCRRSGYSREELLGKNYRILSSGLHPHSFWNDLWHSVSNGNPWRGEINNRAKDGSLYWVDETIVPQIGPDGKPEKFFSMRFDITDTKLAEESLEKANQKYRIVASALERSPDTTVVTDLKGTVLYANPAAYRLDAKFGYSLKIGSPAMLFTPNRFDPEALDRLVETVRSGLVFCESFEVIPGTGGKSLEFSDHRKEQPSKVLTVTASPLENHNGEVDGILLVKRDITDETVRKKSLEEITTAMDAANDCVFMFDADTLRFVYANQGAIKQVGYQLDELRLMSPVDIKPHFSLEEFRELIRPLKESPGQSVNIRTEHQRRDGQRIPVEISLQLVSCLGQNGRFIAIVRDIREQICTENALEAAKEQAELSNRVKSDFLANMSHEIRTPMTAILGFADLLVAEDAFRSNPELASSAVQTIRSNANHLLTIINDILDMSKIESGRMTVEQIEMNPIEIVQEVLSLLRPSAIEKRVNIRLSFDSEVPLQIYSDPTRLRQILVNLIGNAIKFTETGSVTLRVCLEPSHEKLKFSVIDTGIGMTKEQCDEIRKFKAFTQAENSVQRQFGGTGLGLRISNAFATLLGGSLSVESTRKVGSTFSFKISTGNLSDVAMLQSNQVAQIQSEIVVQSRTQPSPESETAPLTGLHILLAEDGLDNQRLISFLLKKAGASVTIADNGRIAAELIESFDQSFDVVLMDMQMPELDGFEATRRLRKAGHSCPIVALTAHAMNSDRQKCLDAGCDDYVSKPIDRESLIQTVRLYGRLQNRAASLFLTDVSNALTTAPIH